MFRIAVVAIVAALFACSAGHAETRWRIVGSEGLDAVLLVGALSGDKLQGDIYTEEIAHYRAGMRDDERAALDRIGAYFVEPGRGLAGPNFAYDLAAAPDLSYQGVKMVLADPEPFLQEIGAEGDQAFNTLGEDFYLAYSALERLKFPEHWRDEIEPLIAERSSQFKVFLDQYNIIPLQQKYIARALDETVEVILLHFNKPYGIRVRGQRFATFHGWDEEDTLRIAVHEIFHPPFNPRNPELREAGARIAVDPLIQNIIATADPSFGYSALRNIVDEDSTQALDMVVSLKLGIDRDPADYWRTQDDGMHILAAAIYDAMKETGFAETGGDYEAWFIDALSGDILSPAAIERRARSVLGDEAIDKWKPEEP